MTEPAIWGLMQVAQGVPANTQEAARTAALLFLRRVAERCDLKEAFLFGTHARHEAQSDSDVDVAVVLNGQRGRLTETVLLLSNIAYDVFMETGVLIDAHPLWDREWDRPSTGPNPYLVENIKRDGIRL